MRVLIFLRGMWFHSFCNTAVNCWTLLGTWSRDRTRLSSSSHRCSMGDKSGLYGGQSSGITLFWVRKSRQTCWNVRLCRCTKGITHWRSIRSLYWIAFKFPLTTIRGFWVHGQCRPTPFPWHKRLWIVRLDVDTRVFCHPHGIERTVTRH